MIDWINTISSSWVNVLPVMTIQNILFLCVILFILYLLRHKNARLLKAIALVGLIKLFIPPFVSMDLLPESAPIGLSRLSEILIITPGDTIQHASLSFFSIMMLVWLTALITLILGMSLYTFRLKRHFKDTLPGHLSYLHPFKKNINVHVVISGKNHSPFVLGLFKPYIVLPSNWTQWKPHLQKTVLSHELMHIREKDHWINYLKMIALAVHFFNPLVWILIRRYGHYSEMVCDDRTIHSNKTSRINYSRYLIHIAETTVNFSHENLLNLAFSKTHKLMKRRINYQLSKKEDSVMNRLNLKSLVLITVLAAAIIPFSLQCSKKETPESPASLQTKPEIGTIVEEVIVEAQKVEPTKIEAQKVEPTKTMVQKGESPKTEAQKGESPMKVSAADERPKLIKEIKPVYPEIARQSMVQGVVVIQAFIDEEGQVYVAKVIKSVPLLDQAAIDAVRQWKYSPAKLNGKPVRVQADITITFRLK